MDEKKLGAIILAAGKGKRMNSKSVNKVVLSLADKPMIVHAINLLQSINIKEIVVVVGFAKKSVISLLGNEIIFAEQKKRLGTAHAVSCGLRKVPDYVTDVLIINGDDSAFYTKNIIDNLIKIHFLSTAALTFLTIDKENPLGLGRVVRGDNGRVISIIEEKDASEDQRLIKEINPGCYIFKVSFLKKYLKKVVKSKISGEYYLTSLIGIGIANNETIETLKGGALPWRGVNTKEELLEAEKLFFAK
jgi:bifunctional UDP-N-acetylglucosamine pyrophosphorylase/glucosamine-1-phosphate N-acetyltransferase